MKTVDRLFGSTLKRLRAEGTDAQEAYKAVSNLPDVRNGLFSKKPHPVKHQAKQDLMSLEKAYKAEEKSVNRTRLGVGAVGALGVGGYFGSKKIKEKAIAEPYIKNQEKVFRAGQESVTHAMLQDPTYPLNAKVRMLNDLGVMKTASALPWVYLPAAGAVGGYVSASTFDDDISGLDTTKAVAAGAGIGLTAATLGKIVRLIKKGK